MDKFEFTKNYIAELANKRGDLSKGSLAHCHVKGLYSILLQENPIIRLFVATADPIFGIHQLHEEKWGIPTAIAFHDHHCDIKIDMVKGILYNVLFDTDPLAKRVNNWGFGTYRFDSKINGGTGQFKPLGWDIKYFRLIDHKLNPGDTQYMKATEIHSVFIERYRSAAWLITEGKENPNYDAIAYSVENLTTFKSEGLYKPISNNDAKLLVSYALDNQV